jgi:branched-chain amino acid transport system ATP-binding protein
MLVLDQIHTYYDRIHALKGVSLTVEQGEIVTLIGSNGAGKTTTLRTISGLLKPRAGSILLEGTPIDELPAHEITRLGISHSPEGAPHLRPADGGGKSGDGRLYPHRQARHPARLGERA